MRALLVFLTLCFIPTALFAGDKKATCGGLDAVGLAKAPLPLLGGRLRMRAPNGTTVEAAPHSIMGAPDAAQQVSRLFYEGGGSKLVVMARESFRLPGADLAATIREQVKNAVPVPAVSLERFADGKLAGALAIPERIVAIPGDPEAFLVMTAYLVSPSGTLASVRFYVDQDLAQQGEGCRALVRSMLASLAPGDVKLDAGGGERKLSSGVSITLTAGQVLTAQKGPDFVVYRVTPIIPSGKSGEMGLYLGGHPGGDKPPNTKKISGRVFGQSVEFDELVTPEGSFRQAVLDLPGDAGIKAHVFMNSNDPEIYKALIKTAESLRK